MRSANRRQVQWGLCALAAFSLGCSLASRLTGLETTSEAQPTQTPGSGAATSQIDTPAGSGAEATAVAPVIQTQVITSPGQAPADIPVMEGEKSAYVGSAQAVSYFIGAGFDTVLDFYRREMENQGWSKTDYGTALTETYAELHYEKDGRKAVVVITEVPFVNRTTVVITLE